MGEHSRVHTTQLTIVVSPGGESSCSGKSYPYYSESLWVVRVTLPAVQYWSAYTTGNPQDWSVFHLPFHCFQASTICSSLSSFLRAASVNPLVRSRQDIRTKVKKVIHNLFLRGPFARSCFLLRQSLELVRVYRQSSGSVRVSFSSFLFCKQMLSISLCPCTFAFLFSCMV